MFQLDVDNALSCIVSNGEIMHQKGTVKWFNNAKGFGFITADEGGDRDIFVHYSALDQDGYRTLREGDSVEFELVDGPKGPSASEVKCLAQESVEAEPQESVEAEPQESEEAEPQESEEAEPQESEDVEQLAQFA